MTVKQFALALIFLIAAPVSVSASEIEMPQAASATDMSIFDRYVGVFRSDTKVFDDGETAYYFTIDYHWFDKNESIIKYIVAMVIPSQDRTLTLSEGFYGYDPFNERLYAFGAFTRSNTGWGAVGRFDHESGARATWAKSMSPDGVVTYVRDEFEIVDENTWKNVTRIKQGDDGEWRVAIEDLYTRVSDDS